MWEFLKQAFSLEILKGALSSILLNIILSPILGWSIMFALLGMLDAIGVDSKKVTKGKCWMYTSGLVLALSVLIHVFSS